MTRNLNRLALIATAIVGITAAAQDGAPPPPNAAGPTRYSGAADSPVAPDQRTDVGWNKDWALLFSLNNPFAGGSILSSHAGTVSGMYYLSDTTGVRAGITLSRNTNPATITKVTVFNGPDETVTYTVGVPGTTESNLVSARGEYLMRLATGAIAPYAGAGLAASYSLSRRAFVDEVSVVDQRREWNDRNQSFSVALTGLVGAEWRIHSQFAFFAEYGLALNVWQWVNFRSEFTTEVTTGGVPTTSRTINETAVHEFLNLSTGLFQGGSLGFKVLF